MTVLRETDWRARAVRTAAAWVLWDEDRKEQAEANKR